MLDLRLIRAEPDAVRARLDLRGAGHLLADVLAADERRREVVRRIEALRTQQNALSKSIGKADPSERDGLRERASGLKADINALEPELRDADEHLEMVMARLPNLTHESVPAGATEDDNVEVRTWGTIPSLKDPRDHLDIGKLWGVVDTERAARASGTRFGYMMGEAVWIEMALVRFALETLRPHGFVPVIPPVMVNREVMYGAGDLPSDEAQYYTTQDGKYLTGTSEQALAALHADEDLPAEDLPQRYSAFSSCFRREAGSYGKDTRGIFRVHQFDKVEMFSFCDPAASWDELEFLLAREEELFQALGLPYRVVNKCAGDLGAKSAKTYDIEAWFAGQGRYRELTSASNCTDYQARRLRINVASKQGKRVAHTLNGTAFAIGRTIVAIMENFQDPDGRVAIPEALHPYLPPGVTSIPSS